MTTVKSLAIVALLFGGTSLALAQTAPTTGGSPPAGVVNTPGGPGYASGQTGQAGHAAKHKKMHMSANGKQHKKTHMSAKSQPQKKMYMSAKSNQHHKGSKLTPADKSNPNVKQ
jgi:3'-phosphoadenosine 5'-phosphosulfate (PAPS) 3'-phosphatase